MDASLEPQLNRWLWLVKLLLVVPHCVVLALLWLALVVLSMVAFFATRSPAAIRGRSSPMALASGAAATYLLTAIAVALDLAWAVPVAVAAALLGLVLKALYFHPWLSVGVLLDVGVPMAALLDWPVTLS